MLFCSKNAINELDVSKCPEIYTISCSDNNLSTLDVSKNVMLKQMWCNNNDLTVLDLSNNAKLITLGCANNYLPYTDLTGYYIYVVNKIPSSRTVLTAAEMRAVEFVLNYDYSK